MVTCSKHEKRLAQISGILEKGYYNPDGNIPMHFGNLASESSICSWGKDAALLAATHLMLASLEKDNNTDKFKKFLDIVPDTNIDKQCLLSVIDQNTIVENPLQIETPICRYVKEHKVYPDDVTNFAHPNYKYGDHIHALNAPITFSPAEIGMLVTAGIVLITSILLIVHHTCPTALQPRATNTDSSSGFDSGWLSGDDSDYGGYSSGTGD